MTDQIEQKNLKIGVALPQVGSQASPETITHMAVAIEEMGFDSVWVLDRLLPFDPADPFT